MQESPILIDFQVNTNKQAKNVEDTFKKQLLLGVHGKTCNAVKK